MDIRCPGGDQAPKNIKITNGTHRDSAPGGISCGSVAGATITGNSFSRNVPGSPNKIAVRSYGNNIVRANKILTEYQANYAISDTYYSSYETPLKPITAYDPQPVIA